jgi:hypothetical protein
MKNTYYAAKIAFVEEIAGMTSPAIFLTSYYDKNFNSF